MWVLVCGVVCSFRAGFHRAHWSRGGQGFEAQDLPDAGSGPLAVCSFPFIRLSCSSLGALLANMALFSVLRGFLAVFICLVCVCIALVLCVACGAFVCVSG